MACPRFLLRTFTAGMLLIFTVSAHADSLRADFSPLTLRPRTNAPALFDLTLHHSGAGLLEGVVEVDFEVGDLAFRQHTAELTLAPGRQSVRLITPPMPHQGYGGVEAHLRFLAKKTTLDLGRFTVVAEVRTLRNSVVAVCDGRGTGGRDGTLWQSLRRESLFPPGVNVSNVIATAPVFLPSEDFPANPLALFAYDLVLLDGDGLAQLRERQLAALIRWVEAGGSLCVLPGRGLKDGHAEFLRTLTAATPAAVGSIGESGEWQGDDAQPRLLHVGLGRVVLARHPENGVFASDEWKRAAGFLWRMRRSISEQMIGGSGWSPERVEWLESSEDGKRRNRLGSYLQTLLPTSTRLISPGVLALILGGFLVAVGPGDWFLLGALRRRRWTWVVFPLVATGCTWLVIDAAGRALGRTDQRGALVVTDVGSGGRVLRESRFELLLTARNRDVRVEYRNAFAVPSALGTGRIYNAYADGGAAAPLSFAGTVPARYIVRQQLRQWTPQFNRVASLEAIAASGAAMPWPEIEAALAEVGDPFPRLREIFNKRTECALFLFHGDGSPQVLNSPTNVPHGLEELCRGPRSGLAGLFSGTAPDAGGDAADLTLFDPSDLREWVLVISRKTPDGVQLVRRFFRKDLK
ncbi:MAG: hypothetical protein K8R23_14320 [Chthoniobacter sp.]|nr:hypothetical protein [Chthoniobacter sp.]